MFGAIRRLIGQKWPRVRPATELAVGTGTLAGVEVVRYLNGNISRLRDSQGRTWSFTYAGGKIVRFTDVSGQTWCEENGRWHGFDAKGAPARKRPPLGIQVDQRSLEVTVVEAGKSVIFRPCGTTCLLYVEERNGSVVDMTVTEFATMPARTKVAVERRGDGVELLAWIEDANGRVYRFDYDDARLVGYVHISPTQVRRWKAVYEGGRIVRWFANDSGREYEMNPHLESIDLDGNRYYRTGEGKAFIVRPTGAAYAPVPLALAAGI